MQNRFEPQGKSQMALEVIGNLDGVRDHLGMDMPVAIYRLFQYSVREELEKRFGKQAVVDIFRNAGRAAGVEFANKMLKLDLETRSFMTHLQDTLEQAKIGILRVEEFNFETGEAVLTICEDVDCSGLPVIGETVCNFGEGFLAGILFAYTKKEYIVTEVDCWATGARVCRFEARVKPRGKMGESCG